MGKSIKISVVIPIYNAKHYLASALDSVLSQGENIEIVAVDDNSSDGSAELLSEYAEKEERIKPIFLSAQREISSSP